jgi:hypothetical protein
MKRSIAIGVVVAWLGFIGSSAIRPVLEASSHREAPAIAGDPRADNTDVYAFVSTEAGRSAFVTLISNWIPLQKAESGPNFWGFDDTALYEIRIDNTGDALQDITYQFQFQTTRRTGNTFLYNTGVVTSLTDPDLNIQQTYTIVKIKNGVRRVLGTRLPVCPPRIGAASMPNYATDLRTPAIQTLTDATAGDTKVFCGARAEQFFLDLGEVFDLLQIANTLDTRPPVNSTFRSNVHSIALEVPKTVLTRDGLAPRAPPDFTNSIVGVWSTTLRQQVTVIRPRGGPQSRGGYVQVSRLGMPLVNEVVIPLRDKDNFNGSHPRDDAQFLSYVQDPELARLYTALFTVSVPPVPRADLVSVFLTGNSGINQPPNVRAAEMLRLNMSSPILGTTNPNPAPNRLGVIAGDNAGYPNGRRVIDDVVDISLRVVAGVLVTTPVNFNVAPNNTLTDGINVEDASQPFLTVFPYLADPTPGK